MRHYSHLNTAESILSRYNGSQPFGLFIKEFFKAGKKYGSKDRRRISALCYAYFRLGRIARDLELRDRILLGLFLTADSSDELLEVLKPDWNNNVAVTVKEKLSLAGYTFSSADLFPAIDHLEKEIDQDVFALSHFIQPDLFLRLRPNQEETVKAKLAGAGIAFEEMNKTCLTLPNASKLDDVIEINREAVIQDYSSQRVIEILKDDHHFSPKQVWDCCAASGGKSLLLKDNYPSAQLTVSDVRENILANLKKRFDQAGISQYDGFVADLSKPARPGKRFDLIMADVPCSGSGTWGRTPEQLCFFRKEKIREYATRQQQIIRNTWQHLNPGGYFLYITCSVYKEENEGAVEFVLEHTKLQLQNSRLFQGFQHKADTLFAALFRST